MLDDLLSAVLDFLLFLLSFMPVALLILGTPLISLIHEWCHRISINILASKNTGYRGQSYKCYFELRNWLSYCLKEKRLVTPFLPGATTHSLYLEHLSTEVKKQYPNVHSLRQIQFIAGVGTPLNTLLLDVITVCLFVSSIMSFNFTVFELVIFYVALTFSLFETASLAVAFIQILCKRPLPKHDLTYLVYPNTFEYTYPHKEKAPNP